jgi:hypothetical protein
MFVKAILSAMADVKTENPPETNTVCAPLARMVSTSTRPRRQVILLAITSKTVARSGALEKGDTLTQRRLEGDFAAHRAFR